MEDLSKVLIFGIDGLQLSQVIPEKMPNLSKLKSRGTFWSEHHSVFPTVTRVNTVSMLTGCNPGTHGLAGNYVVLRDYDPSEVIPLLQPELEEVTAKIGPVLKVPNIVNIIAKYGLKFAAVNIGSTGNAYLHNYDKSPNGIVIHPEFCIPDTLEQDIQDRFGKWPAKTLYDEDRQEKAMEILLSYVLDELDPSVAMFWSNNPDTVQHASPVGGQMSDKALSIVDNQIGKLSRYIDANKNMNILFVSDHGYSTIKDTVNIADNIKKEMVQLIPDIDQILIAPNGGSVLFYINPPDVKVIETLIDYLIQQPWCGNLLTSSKFGDIEGSVDLGITGLEGERSPDLVMSFRWENLMNEFSVPGVAYNSGGVKGNGLHGSMGFSEQHFTLIGFGPDFHEGIEVKIPSGNIDVAPTVLDLIGINDTFKMDGRVLSEGLVGRNLSSSEILKKEIFKERKIHSTQYRQQIDISEYKGSIYIDQGKVF